MGTDLDFTNHLRINKLTSSQFQQPAHELDAVTENTEQPNIEFFNHLVAMLQRRLGNRLENQESPLAIMVQVGNQQRLIIAFAGPDAFNRVRNDEPSRESNFERLMQEIRNNNEDEFNNERRPERRQMPRLPVIPQFPQMVNREVEVQGNLDQQLNHVLQVHQDEELSMEFGQTSEQVVSENIIEEIDLQQLRHQDSIIEPLQQQPNNGNEQERNQFSAIVQGRDRVQYQINQIQNKARNPEQMIASKNNNQTINHLNQNSSFSHAILRKREVQCEPEVTCWQAFTQMIANFFRRNP